jgi:hypothetical protein
MAKAGQRKCLCCNGLFDPDPRNLNRQRYCSNTDCRRASKLASQSAWLTKPQNIDYFRDPVHVVRVQAWRAAHPGYSRAKSAKSANSPGAASALQEPLFSQVIDSIEETPNRCEIPESSGFDALQDLLNAPTPVLAGLIAHLFDLTLQEDIASTTRRLVQLGHDLIDRSRHENHQTRAAP